MADRYAGIEHTTEDDCAACKALVDTLIDSGLIKTNTFDGEEFVAITADGYQAASWLLANAKDLPAVLQLGGEVQEALVKSAMAMASTSDAAEQAGI